MWVGPQNPNCLNTNQIQRLGSWCSVQVQPLSKKGFSLKSWSIPDFIVHLTKQCHLVSFLKIGIIPELIFEFSTTHQQLKEVCFSMKWEFSDIWNSQTINSWDSTLLSGLSYYFEWSEIFKRVPSHLIVLCCWSLKLIRVKEDFRDFWWQTSCLQTLRIRPSGKPWDRISLVC